MPTLHRILPPAHFPCSSEYNLHQRSCIALHAAALCAYHLVFVSVLNIFTYPFSLFEYRKVFVARWRLPRRCIFTHYAAGTHIMFSHLIFPLKTTGQLTMICRTMELPHPHTFHVATVYLDIADGPGSSLSSPPSSNLSLFILTNN